MRYLMLLGVVISTLLMVSPVLADGDPGIVAEVNIVGVNPDAYVNLYGPNPDVFINGVDIDQTVSQAIGGAVQSATPNSVYVDRSPGVLPPLGIVPEINAIAPGKYTQPVAGNAGYFSVQSNLNPFVYKGAGCGVWGVSEGYPDLWSRRQLAGITIDYTIQKERLAQTQVALVKAIGEVQKNNASIETVGVQLNESLDNLKAVTTDLSVAEQEAVMYRQQVSKQFNDMSNQFLLLSILSAIGFVFLAVLVIVLFISKKSHYA